MKDKFTILKSTAVPIPAENIDTDQIIPARFLKATTREGFGDNLFRDWRYDLIPGPSPKEKGEDCTMLKDLAEGLNSR